MEFYFAVGSLVFFICLGLAFAQYNLYLLRLTKQERLEARRAEKKIKNEQLRKFYGLDKK